ncbi:MAG: MerR family transcriptional regulator [Polyangiaceae bacterium]|jgi:DNA-binding transcriptional MerR regulator|nr:MerR family transcriptional regulator [Polyangiaceae bacterium]
MSSLRRLPTGHVERMYYRIGEAARLIGEKPHVLRYWETEFRCIRPTKSVSGHRVYSRRDVDTLMKVRTLLKEQRFTIEGARKRLREGGIEPVAPDDPARDAVRRLRVALLDIRQHALGAIAKLGPP